MVRMRDLRGVGERGEGWRCWCWAMLDSEKERVVESFSVSLSVWREDGVKEEDRF